MTETPPPPYRLSVLPGTTYEKGVETNEGYEDDKPSISLTGWFPDTTSDIYTPPSGTGLGDANLRDFDARRRFGRFGSRLVQLQRAQQSRETPGRRWEWDDEGSVDFLIQKERERQTGNRVKRQLLAICKHARG